MADLDLVPTDDLIEELRRRSDCGVVALGRANAKGHNEMRCSYTWWGGLHQTLGVAHDVAFRIISEIKLIKDDDDGDPKSNATF